MKFPMGRCVSLRWMPPGGALAIQCTHLMDWGHTGVLTWDGHAPKCPAVENWILWCQAYSFFTQFSCFFSVTLLSAKKFPPLITRQRMYEFYLVFPKSSLLHNILCKLGCISAVPSLLWRHLRDEIISSFLNCWHSQSPGKTDSDQCSLQECTLTGILAPAFKETPSSPKTTKKRSSKDESIPSTT